MFWAKKFQEKLLSRFPDFYTNKLFLILGFTKNQLGNRIQCEHATCRQRCGQVYDNLAFKSEAGDAIEATGSGPRTVVQNR